MTWNIFAKHLRDGDTIALPSRFDNSPTQVKLLGVHAGGHFVYFYTNEFGRGRFPLTQEVELLAEEPQ